jgi:hypothetical protein
LLFVSGGRSSSVLAVGFAIGALGVYAFKKRNGGKIEKKWGEKWEIGETLV